MATSTIILDKLRLLLVRERELMAVRQMLHAHQTWMLRVQRLTVALSAADTVDDAWSLLAQRLVDASPYEFAAVLPVCGDPVVIGAPDDALLLRIINLHVDRWRDTVDVLDLSGDADCGEQFPCWLLGGMVHGEQDETKAIVVVGRTRRTAAFFNPPWKLDSDHIGYLLETLSHVIDAVGLRAALTIERNTLKDQVEQATRWLQLALDDARTARDSAEEASRAKSAFLANMSHELRTPLNAIIGYAELLASEAEEKGQPDVLDDLHRIRSAGRHLLSLISDILDLSKIEAGRMDVRLSQFDVVDAVSTMCLTLSALAETRGNALIPRLPARSVKMYSDEIKFRQILVNLVGNAAKFTDHGQIIVSLDYDEREIRLSVADTGIGMSPKMLARLFEPFHRDEGAIEGRPAGTGLGLAISRRICELLNGRITARSMLGRGSVFEVSLPRDCAI